MSRNNLLGYSGPLVGVPPSPRPSACVSDRTRLSAWFYAPCGRFRLHICTGNKSPHNSRRSTDKTKKMSYFRPGRITITQGRQRCVSVKAWKQGSAPPYFNKKVLPYSLIDEEFLLKMGDGMVLNISFLYIDKEDCGNYFRYHRNHFFCNRNEENDFIRFEQLKESRNEKEDVTMAYPRSLRRSSWHCAFN